MKKSLSLAFLFLLLAFTSPCQEKLKALFIGNSYTYVNELPVLIAQIALSNGDTLLHDQSTPGGYTFELHTQNAVTLSKINAAPWDYVVLQEQSQLPALHPDSVAVTTYPFADTLNRLIKANDSCSVTLFYMTWGRKNGDVQNCPTYPPVCTYEGMQARLRESYLEMGGMFGAPNSPVGVAWKHTRDLYPAIELYSSDESHPSLNGSYLAACTFYGAMFHKSPVGCYVPPGILPNDADVLQQIAYHTVFDSLAVWSVDTTDVHAAFTAEMVAPGCFQFTGQSLNADRYYWSFGDGGSSTEESPLHCYTAMGDYQVILVASDGCKSDSASSSIVITAVRENAPDGTTLSITPDPAGNCITVRFQDAAGPLLPEIFDPAGRPVACSAPVLSPGQAVIDVSQLPAGLYILRLRGLQSASAARFLIAR
jgi:hypothetical protein